MSEQKSGRKCVCVVVPTYNEEENVLPLHAAITEQFQKNLPQYDYEILFIDNHSSDATRERLVALCESDAHVKAIFNAANFGQFNSPYYGLCQSTGDCAVLLCADFQDPVELIPTLVERWEQGHAVVCAVKEKSKENPLVRLARTCYYKLLCRTSRVKQIEHFTGFGLYDRTFIETLAAWEDPAPYLRGIVAELAPDHAVVPYVQQRRRAGKSANNLSTLYDVAMQGFTTYTKTPVRLMMLCGLVLLLASLSGGVFSLVQYSTKGKCALALLLCGIGLVGALNLIGLSILGEYLLTLRDKSVKRPLVIEEKRIGFEHKQDGL